MNDLNVSQMLAAGRREATRKMPYLSKLLYAFVPFETEKVPTIAVSKKLVLLYNPKWMRGEVEHQQTPLSLEEVCGALLHEAGHPMRRHFDRYMRVMGFNPGDFPDDGVFKNSRLSRFARLWNMAGDMCINEMLENAGIKIPGEYLVPRTYGFDPGQTTEFYFQKLIDMQDELQPPDKPSVGSGQCGGCAGNPSEAENDLPVELGRTELEIEAVKKQVAQDILRHEKTRGSVPGSLLDWAREKLTPPPIAWDQKFARLVRKAVTYKNGQTDLGFDRPSRRTMLLGGYGPGKPILPRRRSPVARVAICGDTSGSMSNHDMTGILNVVKGITERTTSEVLFCAIDAKVHGLKKIRTWADAADMMIGRGGTDFRPAFAELEKMGSKRPDIVVFVTDGYGPAPEKAPGWCSVIWVIVPNGIQPTEYGEVVRIET